MLTIRKEQLKVLSNHLREIFFRSMHDHLTSAYPEQTQDMSEDQIFNLIEFGCEKGERFDITAERDICLLVELMVERGRDFIDQRRNIWVRQILADSSLSGHMKIDIIADRMRGTEPR